MGIMTIAEVFECVDEFESSNCKRSLNYLIDYLLIQSLLIYPFSVSVPALTLW